MPERETVNIVTPMGGWGEPWPNVAEIASVLSYTKWSLVGGLMSQMWTTHCGIDVLRPTSDVDMLLHLETDRSVASEAIRALETIGYSLQPSKSARKPAAHRMLRGEAAVDVLASDHHAPSVSQRLRGHRMVKIEGGTRALTMTVNACLEIRPGKLTTISVPSVLGAILLKASAYRVDGRDGVRHLQDAAALLAALEDPLGATNLFRGSDRSRVRTLVEALPPSAVVWMSLPLEHRKEAQAALRILADAI